MKRILTLNAEVTVVIDGKHRKATIIERLSDSAARLDVTPRNDKGEANDPEKAPLGTHTVIAEYSPEGGDGAFHFEDEKKAVKEAAKADSTTTNKPAAAASASAAAK